MVTSAGPSLVDFVAVLHYEDMASLQAGLASREGEAAAADAQTITAPGFGMLIFDSREF